MTSNQFFAFFTVVEIFSSNESIEFVVWHHIFETKHDAFIIYVENHDYNIKIKKSNYRSIMRNNSIIKERFEITLECDQTCSWEITCYKNARETLWKFTIKAKSHNHSFASTKNFRVHHRHQMTDEILKEIAIANDKNQFFDQQVQFSI